MSKDCDGCKFWSERIAQSIGGGPVEALCLNQESMHKGRMVHRGCDKYSPGRAIDDPCPTAGEIECDDMED